ncbi:MAG: hypothetical protein GXO11_05935 [Epsilonproteobacteria bacterium]|nr:hypothetical protein [Campylobacterota bacterium]
MKLVKYFLAGSLFIGSSLSAVTYEASVGAHDFIVSDIKTDGVPAHIKDGTSHTLGLNAGILVKHTTSNNIHIFGKAEVFLDNDQDELDDDHLPIWFNYIIDIDGPLYSFNENNNLLWYIYLDNKQNTVSCIEREIRQHVGLGYSYTNGGFMLALNAYAGFYYIEIDDDTPEERGYSREDTDNGEASHVLELETSYNFTQNLSIYADVKRYNMNMGGENLEDDFLVQINYENANFLNENVGLHLKAQYTKYNFDHFNKEGLLPILPWDNEALVQFYATIPF